jgi:acetoin utilization deacetylase AcuC-like enzyme
MKIIHSDQHQRHAALGEFNRGRIGEAYERPERAERIHAALAASGLGPVLGPDAFGLEPVLRVHDRAYVEFLRTAHAQWRAAGRDGDALPMSWPVRGFRNDRVPDAIDGRLGLYSYDVSTPITAGTWEAVSTAADIALTAARRVVEGDPAAFALCRPPGHHAARDCYGGYCYLNNAAIAAQFLRDQGAGRVAILDVDYHHGNGTQAIFYDRADVMYVSIHGDPRTEYPYFLGHADERGEGAGRGCNLNLPLPAGTRWQAWSDALETACRAVRDFAADALVVSLGVDTSGDDPISNFGLEYKDYPCMGRRVAALQLPTVHVMEGGYGLESIGEHVVGFLAGFVKAHEQR